MKKILIGLCICFLSASFSFGEITGNIITAEHGLMTFLRENEKNYLIRFDPENGEVKQYWYAEEFYRYDLVKATGDAILLWEGGNYRDSLYRYSLPAEAGINPESEWRIYGIDEDFVFDGTTLHTAGDNNTSIITYSLQTGKELSKYSMEKEKYCGLHENGFYTISEDRKLLLSYDLEANRKWEVNIERISYDFVRPMEGYVLLVNVSTREVFCIDAEGNKLWRQQYPELYVNFGKTFLKAGETILIADENYTTYIKQDSGEILVTTAPGIGEIPVLLSGPLLVKIPVISSYYRYGPLANPVEIFDTSTLRYRALLTTPESIVEIRNFTPSLDKENRLLFLPLRQNRVIGIDITTGQIARDFTITLFDDDEGW